MKLIRGMHNIHRSTHSAEVGCVATIGNFDGVHLGHQAVLKQLENESKRLNLPQVVIVFEPQPKEFFNPDGAPARLTRLPQKLELLKRYGISEILCLSFNATLQHLSAQAFVEQVLVEGLGIKSLIVGDDFRFGCDRKGDFDYLKQCGSEAGFTVTDTHTLSQDGKRVSSTRVREALTIGDFNEAEKLLGHQYVIKGRIAHGQKLGRQLGVPTANVMLKRNKAPLSGVYAVTVTMASGLCAQGVANIGVRPTVGGTLKPILEVHLFDFEGDLYGQQLAVHFCKKLRDEVKFSGLEALKAQIFKDIEDAKAFFAK
jgi:riboflavin kinase/FMN adenylyltransferase